jgi:hypothetical protein
MKAEFFEDSILKNRLYRTEQILEQKAAEYVKDTDRLSNFKRAAQLLSCTPERALLGFVAKHIVALSDFVEDLERGYYHPMQQWDEKLGDIINYMILLEALLIERNQEKEEE